MPRISGFSTRSISGGSSGDELFSFTTHTFTTAGRVGRYGPSLSELRSAYSSRPWATNTQFLDLGRATGYQKFTIPKTGIYEIEVAGARGQDSSGFSGRGRGAIIKARVILFRNTKLEMVVGQVPGNGGSTNPGNSYAGAGGGSFVAYSQDDTPIIVAGGGAGSYSTYPTQSIVDGQTRRQPRYSGYNWSPASDGSNPVIGQGGEGYHGGGGGGFFSAGQDYSGYSGSSSMATDTSGLGQSFTHGASFVGGSVSNGGGTWYGVGGSATALTSEGGFGGGGGGHSGNNSGGGGGGYSGGLGGQTSLGGSYLTGIGGGSFIISTATNVATSDGLFDGSSSFNGQSIANIGSYNDNYGYIKITLL